MPDEETIRRILNEADTKSPWLRNLVMILIGTGERISAVLSLKKQNIDFIGRLLFFPAHSRKGRRSKRQSRLVPISTHLAKVLSALVTAVPGNGYIFHDRRGIPGEKIMTKRSVRSAWCNAALAAGVMAPRIHDLRHFAVSRLGKAGISSALTREFIGHKTDAMTKRYMHLESDDLRHAADILGDVVGRLSGGCVPGVSKVEELSDGSISLNSIN